MNATANFIETRDSFVKTIRARVRVNGNAMATARAMMADKDSAEAAAEALNLLIQEFDSLPKEKKAESGLREAIRAVYKDMSTAVSHERRNLAREVNDDATAQTKLYEKLPYRIACVKTVFVAMPHAEFDTLRPAAKTRAANGATGDGDGENGDAAAPSGKNADKAAQAIAALELALSEMTKDRDGWRDRAIAAEATLADLNKTTAARKTRTAKKEKAA